MSFSFIIIIIIIIIKPRFASGTTKEILKIPCRFPKQWKSHWEIENNIQQVKIYNSANNQQ